MTLRTLTLDGTLIATVDRATADILLGLSAQGPGHVFSCATQVPVRDEVSLIDRHPTYDTLRSDRRYQAQLSLEFVLTLREDVPR